MLRKIDTWLARLVALLSALLALLSMVQALGWLLVAALSATAGVRLDPPHTRRKPTAASKQTFTSTADVTEIGEERMFHIRFDEPEYHPGDTCHSAFRRFFDC